MANRRDDEFTPAQQGNRDVNRGGADRDDDRVRGVGDDMLEEGDPAEEDDELDEEDDEEEDGAI